MPNDCSRNGHRPRERKPPALSNQPRAGAFVVYSL